MEYARRPASSGLSEYQWRTSVHFCLPGSLKDVSSDNACRRVSDLGRRLQCPFLIRTGGLCHLFQHRLMVIEPVDSLPDGIGTTVMLDPMIWKYPITAKLAKRHNHYCGAGGRFHFRSGCEGRDICDRKRSCCGHAKCVQERELVEQQNKGLWNQGQ